MMRLLRAFTLSLYVVALATTPALADTLYVPAPPPAAPGHPLRLASDHRAQQIGDLVAVDFNFAVNQATSNVYASKKDASIGLAGVFRLPVAGSGNTAADASKTRSNTNTLYTSMMATVTDVLPSGALVIAGDQKVVVDGQVQTLHIVGTIRPEDIDNTDTVLSTRVANVSAEFKGNDVGKARGLLQKIINALF